MTKDKRVEVDIEMDDKTFLKIAKIAHQKDVTFNDMCNIILEEEIKRLKNNAK